jgi:hypothetical protein
MLITISIFFFSIAVAFAMTARKVWQFRTRRIIPGGYEEADWTDLSIESVRMRLIEIFQFFVHHTILLALKTWMILSSWIKRTDQSIKRKLTQVLHKNAHYPAGGKPSKFIKNIRDHKDEMASAIQKEGAE